VEDNCLVELGEPLREDEAFAEQLSSYLIVWAQAEEAGSSTAAKDRGTKTRPHLTII